jgi:hypothetical protein
VILDLEFSLQAVLAGKSQNSNEGLAPKTLIAGLHERHRIAGKSRVIGCVATRFEQGPVPPHRIHNFQSAEVADCEYSALS